MNFLVERHNPRLLRLRSAPVRVIVIACALALLADSG